MWSTFLGVEFNLYILLEKLNKKHKKKKEIKKIYILNNLTELNHRLFKSHSFRKIFFHPHNTKFWLCIVGAKS